MLEIVIPDTELWDEINNQFITEKGTTLRLEHSLVSLSKWESKWQKPFLTKQTKTLEESLDYIKCMTLTQNVDPKVYERLSRKHIEEINKYMESPMTATYISQQQKRGSSEQTTAELIYYWMISLNIPFECQKWHLNRLLTLINVCSVKNSPRKKMSQKDLMSRNAALNAARKKQLNTKG